MPVNEDGQAQSSAGPDQRTTIKGGFASDTPDKVSRNPYNDSDADGFLMGDRGASGAVVPLGNIEVCILVLEACLFSSLMVGV